MSAAEIRASMINDIGVEAGALLRNDAADRSLTLETALARTYGMLATLRHLAPISGEELQMCMDTLLAGAGAARDPSGFIVRIEA